MSGTEEVMRIAKKLDKMLTNRTTDDASSDDLLTTLKTFPMTFEILQKSKIGVSVNNFRKACSNDSTVALAKSLIKIWKKLLPEPAGSLNKSTSSTSGSASMQRTNSSSSISNTKDEEDSRDSKDSGTDSSQKMEALAAPSTPEEKEKGDLKRQLSSPASDTGDSVRLKCRELLASALRTESTVESTQDIDHVAALIEDHIFEEFRNTDMKYKNRVRSRVSNLKDKKNPSLRENVLLGILPPDRIAVMTAEEMASNDLQLLRQKFTKESINDHQMSKTGGTTTTLFKCGRCGKRNCTYNQVQTRSADEPMTTFVLCNECGNRWKFC